ncbi:hypothetical protein PR048_033548 [Dryococelus australis]|uniref:Uncharacterized protein n=1 Tax=Dryococelus australis TaxID=614101 RepID=A0ABQ9G4Q9_9NEOP|nr:hypothetical protein PR048_033548 [Dryococelus australis]
MAAGVIVSVAVVVAASCWIIAGTPVHTRAFLDHLDRVKSLRCHDPRPSVVELDELMPSRRGGVQNSDETWVPERTVLHRCDRGCGYCRGSNVCGPAVVETVTLAFKVRNDVDSRILPHNQLVEAENHTRCACIPGFDRPRTGYDARAIERRVELFEDSLTRRSNVEEDVDYSLRRRSH